VYFQTVAETNDEVLHHCQCLSTPTTYYSGADLPLHREHLPSSLHSELVGEYMDVSDRRFKHQSHWRGVQDSSCCKTAFTLKLNILFYLPFQRIGFLQFIRLSEKTNLAFPSLVSKSRSEPPMVLTTLPRFIDFINRTFSTITVYKQSAITFISLLLTLFILISTELTVASNSGSSPACGWKSETVVLHLQIPSHLGFSHLYQFLFGPYFVLWSSW